MQDLENYIAVLEEDGIFETELLNIEEKVNKLRCLYHDFEDETIINILSIFHCDLIKLFKLMNDQENYFSTYSSRDLISLIDKILELQKKAINTKFSFLIKDDYQLIINKCKKFLKNPRGSKIPPNTQKIEIYLTIAIFIKNNSVKIDGNNKKNYPLELIGNGSYADVFKYFDEYYNRWFAIKRLKKEFTEKELERFKQEFEIMNKIKSPYIAEVYNYNDDKNEYTMEFLDCDLNKFIKENNQKLTIEKRKQLCLQVLSGFKELHLKDILHRDISPKNILLKIYDNTNIIKMCDFGLVKLKNSDLTTNTNPKGYFNDISDLDKVGFKNYSMLHETYAITKILIFILIGKTNTSNIDKKYLKEFIDKGTNSDKTERFQNIEELISYFNQMKQYIE